MSVSYMLFFLALAEKACFASQKVRCKGITIFKDKTNDGDRNTFKKTKWWGHKNVPKEIMTGEKHKYERTNRLKDAAIKSIIYQKVIIVTLKSKMLCIQSEL